jgi:hypothetical protein
VKHRPDILAADADPHKVGARGRTFRGRFERFDATLTVGEDSAELLGVVDVSSRFVLAQYA